MQARLLIVTGLPCTGKTTVACRLAARYGYPVLGRDLIKEALFDSPGSGDRDWSCRLSDASFAVLCACVERVVAAGGMLAFALSFDEIIVMLFTAGHERALPIWLFNELFRPRERPITNVVAVIVVTVTLLPILLAYCLTRARSEEQRCRTRRCRFAPR